MSETTATNKPTIKPMQVLIMGRVESVRSHDGTRYTQILCPAADAYSRPQVVEVRSKQPIGPKGDEVRVVCQLGGYSRKPFEFKDKSTGEITKVVPVDMTLDALQ